MPGKYTPLKQLGSGGDGKVWLCMHQDTQQLWALKEIRRTGDGRERHELEMMRHLRHPSLPRVIELLEEEDKVILVMEYIQGTCLEDLISGDRRLSHQQVEDTALQISSLLVYLHSRKPPVLHLDLKPSNLILKSDGRLVLVDFGASFLQGHKESVRKGTDGYAAPEQYDLRREPDERTDLYILGALLYRLISGVRYSVMMEKSRIPGCPEPLAGLIQGCLKQNPDERIQSAALFRARLMRIRRSRKREKLRIRFWGGIWLCILACAAAGKGFLYELEHQKTSEPVYEKLLRDALCAPDEIALQLYQEAIFLSPGRREAWKQYLDWKDADALLTTDEDKELRILLHRIPIGGELMYEDILSQDPEVYGEIACRIGTIYYYDYEGSDAVRIADGWFEKAVEAAGRGGYIQASSIRTDGDLILSSDCPEWVDIAQIYKRIGTCYAMIRSDLNGEGFWMEYWAASGLLLQKIRGGAFSPHLSINQLSELLMQQMMAEESLKEAGISQEEISNQYRSIQKALSETAKQESLSEEDRILAEEMERLLKGI